MTRSWAYLFAPAYLALTILLGGSGQGIWTNLALQLIAIVLIVWALLVSAPRTAISVRHLRMISIAGIAWLGVQLVPLPPAAWSALSGRDMVVEGYNLLGMELPWRPVSLDPDSSFSSILALLPAIAMLALTVRIPSTQSARLVVALLGMTFVAVLLGLLQKGSGGALQFYPINNNAAATGPFANSNHMAALLLVAIPFVAAVASRWLANAKSAGERMVAWLFGSGFSLVLLLGIVINGSFSIMLLGLPVIAASTLLIFQRGTIRTGRVAIMIAGLVAVGSAALVASAIGGAGIDNRTSIVIRKDIWTQSLTPVREQLLTGSGLGTFEQVYALTENVSSVDSTYINHAHNDFLQLAVELGLPGLVLMVLFLWWWARQAIHLWRMREPPPFSRAASIACAVLLAHSFVDFPMRTAALSTVFAMALGIMLAPRPLAESGRGRGLGVARHVRLEDLD